MFTPNLSILPEPQRRLWAELRDTPRTFVLYGGTALALRLGHRQSEDFDFFSNKSFRPAALREGILYLKHAEMTQFQDNTLTAIVDRNGPVKLSFFGSLGIKRVQDPDIAEENGVQIASLADLLASKLKTVQLRAEAKDYRDIVATFDAGLSLAEGLAAAAAIYGKHFNGALSLKALTFFEDGDLPGLAPAAQKRLLEAATSVNLKELPLVTARSGLSRQEDES
jgi:nucleotidyltransferase AbiEii toxin of type IV toxin-antitoxin system